MLKKIKLRLSYNSDIIVIFPLGERLMDMLQLETQQISIRIPKSLVAAIDRERQGYQVSRSKVIINALRKEYGVSEVNLDSK